MIRTLGVVACLLLTISALAGELRSVGLELEQASTLPGLPVGMTAKIEGNGRLPHWAALRVRSGDSSEFFVGLSLDGLPGVVEVGGYENSGSSDSRRSLTFPVGYVYDSPWFADSRLNRPGVYRLQLVLSDARTMERVVATSAEAILTVESPKGDDAAVWEVMKRVNPQWTAFTWGTKRGREVAKLVWEEHQESSYAPYVFHLVPAPTAEEMELVWDVGLERFPDTPTAPWIRFEKAKLREQQSLNEMAKNNDKRDVNRAIALSNEARALYLEIDRSTDSAMLRKQVKEKLRELRGKEYFLEQDRVVRAGPQDEE